MHSTIFVLFHICSHISASFNFYFSLRSTFRQPQSENFFRFLWWFIKFIFTRKVSRYLSFAKWTHVKDTHRQRNTKRSAGIWAAATVIADAAAAVTFLNWILSRHKQHVITYEEYSTLTLTMEKNDFTPKRKIGSLFCVSLEFTHNFTYKSFSFYRKFTCKFNTYT